MHIWTITKWKNLYPEDQKRREGLKLRFDQDVDPEVKRACKDFCKWMRQEYRFPVRVPIYVKSQERLKTRDGDIATGTFLGPDDRGKEPYIKIASGDYLIFLKIEKKTMH